MSVGFQISSRQLGLLGWRFLWAKSVRAFNPDVHCARCLVGEYDKAFSRERALTNERYEMAPKPTGEFWYFCGVSYPYVWESNAHLACVVSNDPSDHESLDLYTGDTLTVWGAKRLEIDATLASQHYRRRDESFLTCRNFQLGAMLAHRGLIGFHDEPEPPRKPPVTKKQVAPTGLRYMRSLRQVR